MKSVLKVVALAHLLFTQEQTLFCYLIENGLNLLSLFTSTAEICLEASFTKVDNLAQVLIRNPKIFWCGPEKVDS